MARWHRATTWSIIAIACFSSFARKDVAHATPSGSSAKGKLMWLPLGDSITFGCGTNDAVDASATASMAPNPCTPFVDTFTCSDDAGGYRVPVAWALTQQGYNVSTMGTRRNGPSYVPHQWLAHEGHGRWRIDQIDGILEKSLRSATVSPDLITIHLGTNDCSQGASVSTMHLRLRSLLDHILSQTPRSQVFVASIIQNRAQVECTKEFNKGLPRVVQDFKDKGLRIYHVPMLERTGMCDTGEKGSEKELCTSDQIHPTASGYLKMASAWTLSIDESGALDEISRGQSDHV